MNLNLIGNILGNSGSGGSSYDAAAQSFFDRMEILSNPVPTAYKTYYNNLILELKDQGQWDGADIINVQATYSRTAALQNLKSSSFTSTTTNDYAGDFVIDRGFVGNGSNFRKNLNYNPFDGGTYKYTINNASVGVVCLANSTVGRQDVSGATSLSGGVYIMPKVTTGAYHVSVLNSANVTIPTGGGCPASPVTIGMFAAVKNATKNNSLSVNGLRDVTGDFVAAADFSPNISWTEFCRDISGTRTIFSNNTHSLFFAGNATLDPNKILGIFYSKFTNPIGNSVANLKNRISFIGDSMSGPGAAISADCKYTEITLTTLGNGWIGAPMGIANRTLNTINSTLATLQIPYRNTYLAKDIAILWAGTNDLGLSGDTGANVRTYFQAAGNSLKSAGFKVIVMGVVDRQGGLTGTDQTGFNTQRAALRAAMLTDFPTSTAVANVFSGGSYADYFIDLYADANFQDASNITYYNADKIHLVSNGYSYMATTYVAPTCLLFP